ncbi:hypothetical protein ACFL7D_06305 [candidate division KSB1 bacterium]
MNYSNLSAILSLISVVSNIVLTMIIVHRLMKRGVKINFFLLRMLYPKYVHQYKKIIINETGRTPVIFYFWLITINAALIFAVIWFIQR